MLYKGNEKFKTLHKGDKSITRVFKGDELIFRDVEALYGFKFTIDTTLNVYGTHAATSKTMQIVSTNLSYGPDCTLTVRWGDGTENTLNTRAQTQTTLNHTYPEPGIYQILIIPNTFMGLEPIPGWLSRINLGGDSCKVISIDKHYPDNSYIAERGNTNPVDHIVTTDVKGFFSGLCNVVSIPSGFLDNLSIRENPHTTSLDSFFAGSFALFGQYTGLSLDNYLINWLDDLEFSEVTNFSSMFANCFDSAIVSEERVKRFLSPLRTPAGTNFNSMFSGTFGDQLNRGHSWDYLPADFFPPLDTSHGTDFGNMFASTFSSMAKDSTTATIPSGLFDFLNTSNGTNFSGMFNSTFMDFAPLSPACTIPAGLFDHIDTSNGTNFYNMFGQTFYGCCKASTSGAIPSGLFDFFDTSNGTNFKWMFYRTFRNCFEKSLAEPMIPAGLFAHIDMSGATSAEYMFNGTFCEIVNNGHRDVDLAIPSNLFSVLDFSNCTNFSYAFAEVFGGIRLSNRAGSTAEVIIPDDIFTLDTSSGTNFSSMFYWAFEGCTVRSWSPNSLFNFTSTSNGNNFSSMFSRCFSHLTMEIPAGLFSHIDTTNATNLSNMFYWAFWDVRGNTIPSGLFSTIVTTNATNTSSMFSGCFERFGGANAVTIPTTLFSSIDTTNVINVSSMFQRTFSSVYCQIYPEGIFGGIVLAPLSGTTRNVSSVFNAVFYYDGGDSHAGVQISWEMKDIFFGMTDFSWATAANANNVLGALFRYNRNSSADNTSGSASLVLQHFNFNPNTRTYAFQDRSNLTDYNAINANWK